MDYVKTTEIYEYFCVFILNIALILSVHLYPNGEKSNFHKTMSAILIQN
jgi:hypothetical protein